MTRLLKDGSFEGEPLLNSTPSEEMQEDWIDHLSRFLKSLESEKNGQSIHKLRRSFEAGRKKDRLLPQIEAIYLSSKDREDFKTDPVLYQTWFTQQKFRLTLGLKQVTLISTGDPIRFKENICRLFSNWDPDLCMDLPKIKVPQNLGLSNKQLKMAKKHVDRLSDDQLADMIAKVPDGLNVDGINPENIEKLMLSKGAIDNVGAIAERVMNIKKTA